MKIRITANTDNKIACIKHLRGIITGLGMQNATHIVDAIFAPGEDYSIELNWLQVLSIMKDQLFVFNQESLSMAIAGLCLENEGLKKDIEGMAKDSTIQALNLANLKELEAEAQRYRNRVQAQSKEIDDLEKRLNDLEKRLNDEINYSKGLKKTIESTCNVREVMQRELDFKQGLIDELLGLEHGSLSPVVDK